MSEKKDQIKSLRKSTQILTCLAESRDQLTLSELRKRTDLKRTTLHRLLQSMRELGLVEQDFKSKAYRLGSKLISLGVSALGDLNLHKIALPFMIRLREDTGETVNLSILDSTEILFIERIQSDYLVKANLSVGTRLPVYCTSQGKAILAFLPKNYLDEIKGKLNFKRMTDKTIVSIESLKIELKKISKRGFAINDEELEKGLRAVAAPIFDHTGKAIAAINVSYAIARHPERKKVFYFAEKVVKVAEEISYSLGFVRKK